MTAHAVPLRYDPVFIENCVRLAAEVDECGVGRISTVDIARKLGCGITTVQIVMRSHRTVLPARRRSSDGTRVFPGSGALPSYPPLPGMGRGEWHAKRRHIDAARVITTTVATLAGLAHSLALLDDAAIAAMDSEQRLIWLEDLRQSLPAITHLREALR
jgi:hypothetical protein